MHTFFRFHATTITIKGFSRNHARKKDISRITQSRIFSLSRNKKGPFTQTRTPIGGGVVVVSNRSEKKSEKKSLDENFKHGKKYGEEPSLKITRKLEAVHFRVHKSSSLTVQTHQMILICDLSLSQFISLYISVSVYQCISNFVLSTHYTESHYTESSLYRNHFGKNNFGVMSLRHNGISA